MKVMPLGIQQEISPTIVLAIYLRVQDGFNAKCYFINQGSNYHHQEEEVDEQEKSAQLHKSVKNLDFKEVKYILSSIVFCKVVNI